MCGLCLKHYICCLVGGGELEGGDGRCVEVTEVEQPPHLSHCSDALCVALEAAYHATLPVQLCVDWWRESWNYTARNSR
jgi:hypothetical protein